MVLAVGLALGAHEALGRPDALSGFFQVVHRLFEITEEGTPERATRQAQAYFERRHEAPGAIDSWVRSVVG